MTTSATSRLIFLTGAPDASALQWEDQILVTSLLPAFAADEDERQAAARISAIESKPVWRHVPQQCQLRAPVLFQPAGTPFGARYDPVADLGASLFLSTSSLASSDAGPDDGTGHIPSSRSEGDIISEFYDHSFAIHEEISSSQIDFQDTTSETGFEPSATNSSPSFITSTFYSTSFDSEASLLHKAGPIPAIGGIRNLQDIPDASYLNSISPQTMTVNVIVGIISISGPRSIRTRREGKEMQLVEMLVGDETKAGFSINFWLPHPERPALGQKTETELGRILAKLRQQDILLIRNIALSTFRGKVYGQSLRRELTKTHLLHRTLVEDNERARSCRLTDAEETSSQGTKTRRVSEWVLKFVGSDVVSGPVRGHGKSDRRKILPPDTQ